MVDTLQDRVLQCYFNLKTKCYSFSNLTLKSNFISDVIYSIDPVCDDDENEDGIHLFNLKDANIPITITQEIKYYLTENDALLEKNQIEAPASYHNQIPYNQLKYYFLVFLHILINLLL